MIPVSMDIPVENVSDISVHLPNKPPEMVKSIWPSKMNKISRIELSLGNESEVANPVVQGLCSPRKKKYSIGKKKSIKFLSNLGSSPTYTKQFPDVFKTILTRLSIKTKTKLASLAKNIKKKRFTSDFRNLNAYHYDLIRDRSADPPQVKESKNLSLLVFHKILNAWREFNSNATFKKYFSDGPKKAGHASRKWLNPINPNSPFKILWDILLVSLTLFQLFSFSIKNCFLVELENKGFEILLLIAFYFDLLITMNTKYFREGMPVSDRTVIIKRIVSKNFLSDLVPCFGFSIIAFTTSRSYDFFNLTLLMKIIKDRKLTQRVRDLIIRSRRGDAVFLLMILFIKIFCWAHVLAVLWHFIGIMSTQLSPGANNWLKEKGIEGQDWKTKYLFSFYWSLTTMLTVGYGDISPTNIYEMLYNIFAMFVGCCMFGYSMNKIGEILSQYQRNKNYLNDQMSKVSHMLRKKKFPLETQTKIKRYLQFLWKQEQKEDAEHENFIMNKLSSDLRKEVYLHTNVPYLRRIDAFNNFGDKTLISLARHMKKVCFSPEEFVYREGEHENLNLYFVLEGNLNLVTARDEKILTNWRKYKAGDFFGEKEVFSGAERSLGIVSVDFSTLFSLSRTDLIQVLRKFPSDYEKFCVARDLDVVYNKHSQFNAVCLSCGYNDHPLEKCDFLRYSPNKKMIIKEHLARRQRKERRFKRKKKRSDNALMQKEISSEAQTDFLEVYFDDDELNKLLDLYDGEEQEPKQAPENPRRGSVQEASEDSKCYKESFSRELTNYRKARKTTPALTKNLERHEENPIKSPRVSNEDFPSEKDLHNSSQESSPKDNSENGEIKTKLVNLLVRQGCSMEMSTGGRRQNNPVRSQQEIFPLDAVKGVKGELWERKKTKIIQMEPTKGFVPLYNEQRSNQQQFSCQPNMDAIRIFMRYFPHNNFSEIIKRQKTNSLFNFNKSVA